MINVPKFSPKACVPQETLVVLRRDDSMFMENVDPGGWTGDSMVDAINGRESIFLLDKHRHQLIKNDIREPDYIRIGEPAGGLLIPLHLTFLTSIPFLNSIYSKVESHAVRVHEFDPNSVPRREGFSHDVLGELLELGVPTNASRTWHQVNFPLLFRLSSVQSCLASSTQVKNAWMISGDFALLDAAKRGLLDPTRWDGNRVVADRGRLLMDLAQFEALRPLIREDLFRVYPARSLIETHFEVISARASEALRLLVNTPE